MFVWARHAISGNLKEKRRGAGRMLAVAAAEDGGATGIRMRHSHVLAKRNRNFVSVLLGLFSFPGCDCSTGFAYREA